MAVVEIRPGNGRKETGIVGALAVALVSGTALFALLQPEQGGAPPLYDWQVSAFDGLTNEDQAIHAAMGPAIAEAIMIYDMTGEWPTVEQLDAEFVLPFARDLFWETNGAVEWTMQRPSEGDQGAIYYLGRNGTAADQSAYLGLIRHAHLNTERTNQLEMWVHPEPATSTPVGLKAEALVGQGWRQVVAYSGQTETNRIHGN